MKRFSAPASVCPDPTRPPDDDDSEASLSEGSKKVKTAQSFESLYNSEALSDIVFDINHGEFVFHAHKMIVGLKSERLAALITSTARTPEDNNSNSKPVLYLQELPECSAVFSRFLYFIYSGAVWLHRDYVVPLFKLSIKYGVAALSTHCENYVGQLLDRTLSHDEAKGPPPPSFALRTIRDLYEDSCYREDTKKSAFLVLCRRFADMVGTITWIDCAWLTVRNLIKSDACCCEENLILCSATDWMKRNRIQDKARIQELLAAIRYPRLPRRVLYHLHATSSFKKFPPVQDLIEAAIRFHCFKDVPEAQSQFIGLQYRSRGWSLRIHGENNNNNNNSSGSSSSHAGGGAGTDRNVINNNNNNNNSNNNNTNDNSSSRNNPSCGMDVSDPDEQQQQQHQQPSEPQRSSSSNQRSRQRDAENYSVDVSTLVNSALAADRRRCRSQDRYRDVQPDSLPIRRQGPPVLVDMSSASSNFHATCSPIAAVSPRVQSQAAPYHQSRYSDLGRTSPELVFPINIHSQT